MSQSEQPLISYVKNQNFLWPVLILLLENETSCNPVKDVKFILHRKNNANQIEIFSISNSSLIRNSTYDKSLPTRYLIHGFNGDRDNKLNVAVLKALFSAGYDVNVFVVEWKQCANSTSYKEVRDRLERVGTVVAAFIDVVEELFKDQLTKTELIGHSFGAHVAGFTAKQLMNGMVSAIMGLDPAGPLFDLLNPNERLDLSDAKYVEIIHTDSTGIGFPQPIGHVDHYPNYGSNQPGCSTTICNHVRAIDYFADSITRKIESIVCSGYVDILRKDCHHGSLRARVGGEPLSRMNPTGVFYYKTNSTDALSFENDILMLSDPKDLDYLINT